MPKLWCLGALFRVDSGGKWDIVMIWLVWLGAYWSPYRLNMIFWRVCCIHWAKLPFCEVWILLECLTSMVLKYVCLLGSIYCFEASMITRLLLTICNTMKMSMMQCWISLDASPKVSQLKDILFGWHTFCRVFPSFFEASVEQLRLWIKRPLTFCWVLWKTS